LTALDLISYASNDGNPRVFLHCDDDYAETVGLTLNDSVLRHLLSYGIGLHHAGLSSHDRETVEKMFLNGDLQVLVATSTLAWGGKLNSYLIHFALMRT
jgi:activating signal cointegrator complex subunit 3